jgi:hypothetical protein
MAQTIAATVPSEVAARKLAEWLGKIVHRVQVGKCSGAWCIYVPEAALSRARRALQEVIVAANPRPAGECCRRLGKGAPCARCGKHAHFTVDWIIPARVLDARPACSSACAVALKKAAVPNPVNKRARRAQRRQEQRVKESLGLSGRPLARRTQWTGQKDAYGEGQRAGSGYVRFWLWNDKEWKLNLRSSYEGVGGEPTLRESAKAYADEEAAKKKIAQRWPSQVGKWKAGFILAFEKAIAGAFGPKREIDDFGESKERDQEKRTWRRLGEHREKFSGKNPGGRYLIQGLRPKHRNWVTIDYADDEQRALLNALRRARLGDVVYRVWDTSTVKEIWRGHGRDAKIESWQARRPAGLVGANRRNPMGASSATRWLYVQDAKRRLIGKTQGLPSVMASTLRKEGLSFSETPGGNYVLYTIHGKTRRRVGSNPRISARMMPLPENTMRLGDAMKWGRKLLDAGIGVHLWDGSGWEVDFRPDDAYATPSGHAATGGRRYLSQGAGLIKTWPITLIAPKVAPGMWLTGAGIGHFLAHQKAGVASNPKACKNPLCRKSPARRNSGESLADLDRQFSVLQRELDAMKKSGADKGPDYLVKLQALAALSKRRLAASGIVIRRAGENPRRGKGLRPKRVGIYCRMCGEWAKSKGPYRTPKVGPSKGKVICDLCYRGWRSGRRGGAKWAMNRSARRNQGDAGDNPRIAHEQIVGAFLAGKPKRIGDRYWTDGQLLRVWGNLVAKKDPGGVTIMDAGWRTLLTKNILNTILSHMGSGGIYQQARRWYLSTPQGKVEWTGEYTIPTAGVAANRGRRVRRNGRGENLTLSDIAQWVDNDEGLYNWWRGSRQSKRDFIRENRAELEASINGVLNRPPAQKTWRDYAGTNPRIRAWNIVAYTPGRGRETMQSGDKDKKKAEEIAKVYRTIAKKERRRTRYVVEPFRYSDTASRRNPPEGWVVTQDGETLKTFGPSQQGANGAYEWLQKYQTKSIQRACLDEGYDIVYVSNGKVSYSMRRDFLVKTNPRQWCVLMDGRLKKRGLPSEAAAWEYVRKNTSRGQMREIWRVYPEDDARVASILKNPWYYGYKKGGGTEAFHSRKKPTEKSHGHRYGAVTGPRRSAAHAVRDMMYVSPGGPHTIMRRGKATRANPPELRPHFPYRVMATAELDRKHLSGKTVVFLGMGRGPAGSGAFARVRIMNTDGSTSRQEYLIRPHCLSEKLTRNPLTRRESAELLWQAKRHVSTARSDRASRKHGVASYAAGRAQGKASAVVQYGPRGARRAARKLLERQARTNPHAGLKGLMKNSDAKKAMRFA